MSAVNRRPGLKLLNVGLSLSIRPGKRQYGGMWRPKKQSSSVVKKTKIGFHVVNFNEKKFMWTLFQKGIYRTKGFFPAFSYMLPFVNSQ